MNVDSGIFIANAQPIYRIKGYCFLDNTPVKRRVMAINRYTGEYIGQTLSDALGKWEILNISVESFNKICTFMLDDSGGEALIVDHVIGVLYQ